MWREKEVGNEFVTDAFFTPKKAGGSKSYRAANVPKMLRIILILYLLNAWFCSAKPFEVMPTTFRFEAQLPCREGKNCFVHFKLVHRLIILSNECKRSKLWP